SIWAAPCSSAPDRTTLCGGSGRSSASSPQSSTCRSWRNRCDGSRPPWRERERQRTATEDGEGITIPFLIPFGIVGSSATAILWERGFQVTAANACVEGGAHLQNQFGASAIVARRKLAEPVKSRSNVRHADGIEASRRATRVGASSTMAWHWRADCRAARI